MKDEVLLTKISSLPEDKKEQVHDFIDFLILKKDKNHTSNSPIFGSGKGFFKMAKDFDEPLEDFKEYME